MNEFHFLLGAVLTLGLMWIGISRWGAGGGFVGFILGAILSGYLATEMGVDLGDRCDRYSHYASDC